MKRYEMFEHTADIGLRVYGKNIKELFVNSANGLFEIISSSKNINFQESISLKLEAEDIERLFIMWLSELLYQYEVKKILFKKFDIEEISENFLKAKAFGEKTDLEKHNIDTEIKAITYHQLKIEKGDNNLIAEVILDV